MTKLSETLFFDMPLKQKEKWVITPISLDIYFPVFNRIKVIVMSKNIPVKKKIL